jgi:membrane protease YdiL (CAAX protease family)
MDKIGLLAVYYVALIGVFIPFLSIRSYYKLKAGFPFPPKTKLHTQTLIMHALFLVLALLTSRRLGLLLFPSIFPERKDLAIGAAMLLLMVGALYPVWKASAIKKREKIYRRMPQAYSELGWWAAVSLSAGVVEETVYRGVLFRILFYWFENWWVAAILCAIAFALGHAVQGWKSSLIIFAISVAFQGLVWATGTLYVAMAVHAVYDFIAGFAYATLYKKTAPRVAPSAEPA